MNGFVGDWEGKERTENKLAVAYFKEKLTTVVWRN
jgi:hypothetical protein